MVDFHGFSMANFSFTANSSPPPAPPAPCRYVATAASCSASSSFRRCSVRCACRALLASQLLFSSASMARSWRSATDAAGVGKIWGKMWEENVIWYLLEMCILMYFDRFDLFYVFFVRRNWAVNDLWCRSDVLDMVDLLICGLLICFDRSEFWIVLDMDEWCILCLSWNWWIIGELSHTPVVCVYFGETCQNNVS